MALNARPISSSATQGVAPGHMPSGGRNVAPITFNRIDELSTSFGVQPDPNFDFQGFSGGRGRRPPDPEPRHNLTGILDTDTITFVSLLSEGQGADVAAPSSSQQRGAFHGLLSRAIRAYEGTAAVIHGTIQPRGTHYSAAL